LIHHKHEDGSDYDSQDCPIHRCLENGEKVSKSGEVFWRQDQTSFPVQYWSHAILDEDRVVGAVVTFVDITERIVTEKELRAAKEQADIASQTKSRFLANMSHELRTPMAAILGFTQILQQEVADDEINERLDAISRNGHYLLTLLNDVLDLSRIEAGKLSLSLTSVDLPELLADVEELMQVRTIEYKNTLNFAAKSKLPATIRTDQARLRQILINLIANALKFSPHGQVNVEVDMASKKKIRFRVIDNGIGMDDDQRRGLFQPFTQANSEISQQFGGTGLGLSITRRLVEALRGDISVESATGIGSTFTVLLPLKSMGDLIDWNPGVPKPIEGNPLMEISPSEAKPVAIKDLNARVLIADDMRDVRYITEHFLKKAGCDVTIAENGQQAVDAIKRGYADGNPFELVFMDMQMPVMTGEEAVVELRRQGFDLPIVALTSDAMKGTRKRLISIGFSDYMSKPIEAGKLLRVAAKLLKQN
jgi:two-component system CheB/CheR fusion protein